MNMGLNKSFIDRLFRQVDDVVWDLMTGTVGYKANDGITTIELGQLSDDKTEAPEAQVSVNPFDQFGMAVPAFAQSVPAASINLGDMIYSSASNKVMGWVVKKNEKSFKLMKADGTRSDWSPPKVQMMGFDSGVMVLRSLINMLPGGQSGLGGFQSSLMPLMAMGMLGDSDGNSDGGMDLKQMMPIMLMSQMGLGLNGQTDSGAQGAAGGMASMMPMLMMMNMMGGGNKSSSGKKGGAGFFDN